MCRTTILLLALGAAALIPAAALSDGQRPDGETAPAELAPPPGAKGPWTGDDEETLREQERSLAAERAAVRGYASPEEILEGLEPGDAWPPLFAGLSDVDLDAFRIDPDTDEAIPAFTGFEVSGAAYDRVGDQVYFNSGAQLYVWPRGGSPAFLGTIVDGGGAPVALVGLAFHEGVLYGTKNTAIEAIWRIDTQTLVATVHITYDATADLGGLAIDPATGDFYATDDGANDALVRVEGNGSLTVIAPYPAGLDDIDGLALGNGGLAYLVTDEADDSWYVWHFASASFIGAVTSPYTQSETFAGAAWIPAPDAVATLAFGIRAEAGPALPYYSAFDHQSNLRHVINFLGAGATIGAGELVEDTVVMADSLDNFWRLSPLTGEILHAGATTPLPGTQSWSGMAYDRATGILYASSTNGGSSMLFTLDPATGAATEVGTVTNALALHAIAVDGAGTLWGIDSHNDWLLAIDKTSGVGTVIGPTGVASIGQQQGLAWDEVTDTLYLTANPVSPNRGEWRSVDRTTGATTLLGTLGDVLPGSSQLNRLFWLAIAPQEFLELFEDGFESGDTSAWDVTVGN